MRLLCKGVCLPASLATPASWPASLPGDDCASHQNGPGLGCGKLQHHPLGAVGGPNAHSVPLLHRKQWAVGMCVCMHSPRQYSTVGGTQPPATQLKQPAALPPPPATSSAKSAAYLHAQCQQAASGLLHPLVELAVGEAQPLVQADQRIAVGKGLQGTARQGGAGQGRRARLAYDAAWQNMASQQSVPLAASDHARAWRCTGCRASAAGLAAIYSPLLCGPGTAPPSLPAAAHPCAPARTRGLLLPHLPPVLALATPLHGKKDGDT